MATMIKICLILALFAVSVQSAVSPRLDSLRTKAFRQIDVPDVGTAKITTAVGNDAINQAISWVCHFAPAIERMDTVWVKSTASSVALNSDFNRVAVAEMIWTDTTAPGVYRTIRVPLRPLEDDSIYREMIAKADENPTYPKNPTVYQWYKTFAGRFMMYPLWSLSDSMQVEVHYYADDSLLQAAGSQTSVKDRFLDAVIDYACSKLAKKRNNLQESAMWENSARAYLGLPPVNREAYLEK